MKAPKSKEVMEIMSDIEGKKQLLDFITGSNHTKIIELSDGRKYKIMTSEGLILNED